MSAIELKSARPPDSAARVRVRARSSAVSMRRALAAILSSSAPSTSAIARCSSKDGMDSWIRAMSRTLRLLKTAPTLRSRLTSACHCGPRVTQKRNSWSTCLSSERSSTRFWPMAHFIPSGIRAVSPTRPLRVTMMSPPRGVVRRVHSARSAPLIRRTSDRSSRPPTMLGIATYGYPSARAGGVLCSQSRTATPRSDRLNALPFMTRPSPTAYAQPAPAAPTHRTARTTPSSVARSSPRSAHRHLRPQEPLCSARASGRSPTP